MKGYFLQAVARTGAAMGGRTVVQALLLVMLARAFGSGLFGAWVALTSLAVLVGMVASMGMGYLVLLRSGQGHRRGGVALATGLPWVLWCAGPLLCLYVLLGWALLGQQLPGAVVLWVGVAEIVLAAPTLLLALRLQGSGQAWRAQALYIVQPALRLAYLLVLPWLGAVPDLYGFAFWYAISAALAGLLAAALCWRQRLLPVRWQLLPKWAHVRAGLLYLPTRVCAFGAGELDKILAPLVLVSTLASSYALAARVSGFALLPVHSALAVAQPRLAGLARTDRRGFVAFSRIGLLAAMTYGLIAAIVVMLLAAPVMNALTGGQYGSLEDAFTVVALALVPMVLRQAVGGILLPLGRPLLRVAGEMLGMAVLCFLMPWFGHLGLYGVGLALFASEMIALSVLSGGMLWHWRRWSVDG